MSKCAVITGGAGGIGSAICKTFASNGYSVLIACNSSLPEAIALKEELLTNGADADCFNGDICDSNTADALISFAINRFGGLDVLVNNAGIADQRLFTDISDADWNRMISSDLTSVFNCCRAASNRLIKSKCGSIVNISSVWGISGASCEVHYSAAKAGIIGLTKALAKELGPSGIRVNCVAPGVIETKMNAHLSSDDISALADATPLCRIGKPEEVAEAVYFLASEKSSFITGQILTVDGGFII